jgi:hypothetical protein
MDSLNEQIREYTIQLGNGHIQKAYKGIMTFMSDLRAYLEGKYPDFTAGALYFGYMDMTYFAFTPSELKNRKLKIAIVYLHEECRLELWLAGSNRQIQADYIELLSRKNIGGYSLSQIHPGIDSIIAASIVERPDFDDAEGLKKQIEEKTMEFVNNITIILNQ